MPSGTRATPLPSRHSPTISSHPYKSAPLPSRHSLTVSPPSPLNPDPLAIFSKFPSLAMDARRGRGQGRRAASPNLANRVWWALAIASLALNLAAAPLLLHLFKARPAAHHPHTCPADELPVPVPTEQAHVHKEMQNVDEISVSASSGSRPTNDSVINLDHGDPTMYEAYWQRMGDKGTITIPGWSTMSYFSDPTNLCWFLEPEFGTEIRRLHRLVGNAVAEDCHIIVGTGSTQLFQAALYALSPSDATEPMSVVSAIPYYSSYPAVTDFLRSGLFRWAGDAETFRGDAFIELVCSPNNPDGSRKKAVLNGPNGNTIHDLAYYWPQYTPITGPEDHDIMLFTVSKSTGHAGTRLGWALVKNRDVAKRMIKFIELNTIGVSKDSQVRAARILKVVSDSYESPYAEDGEKFFEFSQRLMRSRWAKLREVVGISDLFSLPEFPESGCKFFKETTSTFPAFAWLKCKRGDIKDCESLLRSHKILTRSGKHFGMDPTFVRVSMLDREDTFNLFLDRLASIQ